jgi:integrase
VSGKYEFTYLDSDGRRRWQTINGNLKDAVEALTQTKAKLQRGERVAPDKVTFQEFADAWLELQEGKLRPRTLEGYRTHLRLHVYPHLGHRRVQTVNEDDITALIARMRTRYKPWTINGVLTPIGRVLNHAARRGLIAENPMRRLERGERPSTKKGPQRTLSHDEITALIGKAGAPYRALIATAVFSGLRVSELLGLTWADVDFDRERIRVRKQLSRAKRGTPATLVDPKTPQAIRDVVLMPSLAKMLRAHKLRSRFSTDSDYVFASRVGSPFSYRNVAQRGMAQAATDAGLPGLSLHDLRHTFASLLIAQGANVVFVARQLGHGSPDITLRIYAHLFDAAEHAEKAMAGLEAAFGKALRTAQ